MKLEYRIHKGVILTLCLCLSLGNAQNQNTTTNPYAPVYVDCPSNLTVRNASSGLSPAEQSWRTNRTQKIIPALESYLTTANISGLDIANFTKQLNSTNVPIIGLSISGGGTQSGLGGLGIWQAFDARYPQAVQAGTGGLTQVISYLSGLSGGAVVSVSLIAANNFSSVSDILKTANFSISTIEGRQGNATSFLQTTLYNTAAKRRAGFPVSVVDVFGPYWSTWLPPNKTYSNYSDFALPGTAFSSGDAPMPIMELAEIVPGKSPEIHGITFPGFNSTNGFNLTTYEVTPFEFGSWAGGRVQGFFPTEYLGTNMSNGSVVQGQQCVQGFDKLTFVQGATSDAFTAWFIDDFYNVPLFAKRSLEKRKQHRQRRQTQQKNITIPQNQTDNSLVKIVELTASTFNLTFNESLWATVPNPFQDYNDEMQGVEELLLLDGSLTGETNPIRPLIIPDRNVDFVIVYEASSDAPYNWNNGTNLLNSALSAHQGGIPFPTIPDVNTMITQNITRQPTFFGCNSSSSSIPLVLYIPNSPWSAYTNFSFMQTSFTPNQVNLTFDNAFQLATYGNGTVDAEWPACLACAAVVKSLDRLGVQRPAQCERCFDRHCWDGKNSTEGITNAERDPVLRLNSTLGFVDWNNTVWSV